jgi:hypothetical protein
MRRSRYILLLRCRLIQGALMLLSYSVSEVRQVQIRVTLAEDVSFDRCLLLNAMMSDLSRGSSCRNRKRMNVECMNPRLAIYPANDESAGWNWRYLITPIGVVISKFGDRESVLPPVNFKT